MKYSMNDYLPYISDIYTRLEICPDSEFAARLVSEHKLRGAQIIPLYSLLEPGLQYIPNPSVVINAMREYASTFKITTVFVSIESYLALLHKEARLDFFIGLRRLLDRQQINARFLINRTYMSDDVFKNPKYEDAMYIVHFLGSGSVDEELDITLIPSKWVMDSVSMTMTSEILKRLGDYAPAGVYRFPMDEAGLPAKSYDKVSVIFNANEALRMLYNIDVDFDLEQANLLLVECKDKKLTPIQVLAERFGGAKNLTCEKIPARLAGLKNDALWDICIWFLKSRIDQNTYLYNVLQRNPTSDNFLAEYIVFAAVRVLGDKNAVALADERASAITRMKAVEPLIAKFVSDTDGDFRSIPFLNCKTDSEIQSLIRLAAASDLSVSLPDVFDSSSPELNCYFAPYFDYGNEQLSTYFTKLRRFRIKNDIDEAFVREAYCATVPKEIENRDKIIHKYDDGETALLIVDGLGAEYYPLLINMAKLNHLKIAQSQIVSVNLPTSTDFNKVTWNDAHVLQEVKRADSISHEGWSKGELCNYEENLAEVMLLFERKILTRVVSGLKQHKRVVVTADHGSSYLAVTAHKRGLTHTIAWDKPDDWRYASLPESKNVSEEIETAYHPNRKLPHYYVVKGYNRLSKRGPKFYGLHGGATLEERLVPFVVFTNESVQETPVEEMVQFSENEGFDIF